MSDERVRHDGSLPSFGTPAIDPKTGLWTEAWRPIIEMLFERTGGDFDGLFRAAADADATRAQFADITRSLDILSAQVASLRDASTAGTFDDARLTRLEQEIQGLSGRLGGTEATASNLDDARFGALEGEVSVLAARVASLDAAVRAESIFADGEYQDVSFKKITINNTANLKGNATIAGATYQLGFFSFGGVLQQTVTFTNTNGAIGGLTISNPPTQAEVQALRDACETLADDTRNFLAAIKAYNLLA